MPNDRTYFDEDTLNKAYWALEDSGVRGQNATDAIMAMINRGLLIRERATESTISLGGLMKKAFKIGFSVGRVIKVVRSGH